MKDKEENNVENSKINSSLVGSRKFSSTATATNAINTADAPVLVEIEDRRRQKKWSVERQTYFNTYKVLLVDKVKLAIEEGQVKNAPEFFWVWDIPQNK